MMSYQAVLTVLKNADNVREASDAVQVKRAEYGEGYYKKYAGGSSDPSSGGMSNEDCPFLVRVRATDLRIRKGAGTDTAWTGKYTGVGVFTIVEVKNGKGSKAGWGRLKSGAGWISLDYCIKL